MINLLNPKYPSLYEETQNTRVCRFRYAMTRLTARRTAQKPQRFSLYRWCMQTTEMASRQDNDWFYCTPTTKKSPIGFRFVHLLVQTISDVTSYKAPLHVPCRLGQTADKPNIFSDMKETRRLTNGTMIQWLWLCQTTLLSSYGHLVHAL